MKTEHFSPNEKKELTEAARKALASTDEQSPWVQLGMFFDDQRKDADRLVEPRHTRKTD